MILRMCSHMSTNMRMSSPRKHKSIGVEHSGCSHRHSEGEGECASCGMPFWCRFRHHCVECPYIWHNVLAGPGHMLPLARPSMHHGGRDSVQVGWCLTRHAHTHIQLQKHQGFSLWPQHHASVPSYDVVRKLHGMCKKHAAHFIMVVMHIVARDVWYTKQPRVHSAPAQAYWVAAHVPPGRLVPSNGSPLGGRGERGDHSHSKACFVVVSSRYASISTGACIGAASLYIDGRGERGMDGIL